ncbi:MAG TPA: hypothetical protein PKN22_01260 [Taishania sp.]|jgi:hypothetical protein|nr:hypothetical protein [Taishania sp.]
MKRGRGCAVPFGGSRRRRGCGTAVPFGGSRKRRGGTAALAPFLLASALNNIKRKSQVASGRRRRHRRH